MTKDEKHVTRHWRLMSLGGPGEAPLREDTTQINVSDIWRPEEGAIFSRSAVPRSTEIPNLSVTNDSAQQQLRSGTQQRDKKSHSLPQLEHSKWMDDFKSSVAVWYLHRAARNQRETARKNLSVKQGSDPGWIRLFDVSAAHSCHHGNHSLKGSN